MTPRNVSLADLLTVVAVTGGFGLLIVPALARNRETDRRFARPVSYLVNQAPPPQPERWWSDSSITIAFSESTRSRGIGKSERRKEDAERMAVQACGQPDCKVVAWVRNGCVALAATGLSEAFGWAWSTRRNRARERALAECNQRDTGCQVVACECSPGYGEQYIDYCDDLQEQGRYKDAIPYATWAIAANPGVPRPYLLRAKSHMVLGDLERAIEDASASIRIAPNDGGYMSRIFCGLALGRDVADDCKAYLNKLAWEDSDALWVAMAAHFHHVRAGREAEGRAVLEQAERSSAPEEWPYPILRYMLGRIDARALYQAAGNDKTKMNDVQAWTGLKLSLAGRDTEAIAHLRYALDHMNVTDLFRPIIQSELRRIEGR